METVAQSRQGLRCDKRGSEGFCWGNNDAMCLMVHSSLTFIITFGILLLAIFLGFPIALKNAYT